MRNKGFFWSITIALALACLYQLSFTYATNSVEGDAKEYALEKIDSLMEAGVTEIQLGSDTLNLNNGIDSNNLVIQYSGEYIKSKMNEQAHFSGATYGECKENEINLGLDLKGGMSVTLEINVPSLVAGLAGNTRSQQFNTPFKSANEITNSGDGDFIDNFVAEYEKANPGVAMAKLFHMHNPEGIAAEATNEEVGTFLKEKAIKALDGVVIIIEKRVNQFGVAQPTIQKQPNLNRVFVELPGIVDKESARKQLVATANLEFYEIYDNEINGISGILLQQEAFLSQALFGEELSTFEEKTLLEEVIPDSNTIEPIDTTEESTIENLLDGEALLSGEDNSNLLEDNTTTDADTPDSTLTNAQREKKYPITSLMSLAFVFNDEGQPVGYSPGSVVGYANVKDTATLNFRINHAVVKAEMPQDIVFMWDAKELEDKNKLPTGTIALHAIKVPSTGATVNGKHIKASSLDNGTIGLYGVRMEMTSTGSEKWKQMTTANVNKQIAITMDNHVFSAPVVNEIMSSNSSITGNFTLREAQDLSGLLNAGALPAELRIIDESVVGPTIGASNINAGMWSFIFALLIVLVYMVFYYNKAGLVADAALVINIFLLIGALASLKAILTLPGIAGIVLTIGMSVDANVLIFERIREELRHAKGLKASIKDGYAKALSAILDANITTLLTGIVLVIFGTGPIKGFATTLIIGIFTSFFAAVVITRLIITAFVDRDKKISFSTKITKNWFTKTNVQFVKSRKKFYILSAIVILLGAISLMSRGLDYGVDFAGGRQYKVVFSENKADYEGIKSILKDEFEGNQPGVKMVDNSFTALITTKYRVNDPGKDVNKEVEALVINGLDNLTGSTESNRANYYEIVETKMISPTISKDLKSNSIYAISISLLIIFLYILFRFRKWQYGLGALIAMAHDVIIVLSIFSICYGWIGFSMEIDQAFIAAILTVVGYSINDTVVVFDRIREYLGLHPKKDRKDVINMALNSTLGRTVNTSVSTFIVLLVIFLFGGPAIKGFVFALMIGVIVGTYSSLFIATPAVIDFEKKNKDKK